MRCADAVRSPGDAVQVLRAPPTGAPLPGASLLGPLASAVGAGLGAVVGRGGGGSSGGGAMRDPPLVLEWVGTSPKSFPLQLKQAGR